MAWLPGKGAAIQAERTGVNGLWPPRSARP